jgi:hypothetical protein
MSSGFRPNEQMHLPGLGVPVDPWTGQLLPPVAIQRLARLKAAERTYREVLHELAGTTYGTRPGDKRMDYAFTKLDESTMWAFAAIIDRE